MQLVARYPRARRQGPVSAASIERVACRGDELLEAFRDPSATPPAEAVVAVPEFWQ
ncbi:MAG TPA: hypothetical protein VFA95_01585 [Gammaproteobacteria bacterium]|nr:hypothetical protein [Gammaproteobacteria bacterium]